MALTASTGVISLAALRGNLDDKTATLTTAAAAGRKDATIPLRRATLADTDDVSVRSVAFTPQDDCEVRDLFVRVTDTTASRVITASVEVDDGDTTFLLDETISASVTTIVGTADSRPTSLDLRTTTGRRFRLLKGVRYRLILTNTSAGTTTGIAIAGLQLRYMRRGGTSGVPRMPFAFTAGANLDVDKLNWSLRRLSDDIARNLGRRYVRSMAIYEFDGVTNATAAAQRRFHVRRPAADGAVTIAAVEFVSYGGAAVTATVTCSDTDFPTLSVATSATATTEVYTSSSTPVDVPSNAADVYFEVAYSGAYTVTRGYLVVHFVCDRGNQGDSFTPYAPSLFDATSTGVGVLLDAQLTAAATSVAADTAADKDLRCETFVVRGLGIGGTAVHQLQSGAGRRIRRIELYVAAAVGENLRVQVTGGVLTLVTIVANGAGVGTIAVNGSGPGATATTLDDPMDSADDTTVTFSDASGAGTIEFGQCNVWWS